MCSPHLGKYIVYAIICLCIGNRPVAELRPQYMYIYIYTKKEYSMTIEYTLSYHSYIGMSDDVWMCAWFVNSSHVQSLPLPRRRPCHVIWYDSLTLCFLWRSPLALRLLCVSSNIALFGHSRKPNPKSAPHKHESSRTHLPKPHIFIFTWHHFVWHGTTANSKPVERGNRSNGVCVDDELATLHPIRITHKFKSAHIIIEISAWPNGNTAQWWLGLVGVFVLTHRNAYARPAALPSGAFLSQRGSVGKWRHLRRPLVIGPLFRLELCCSPHFPFVSPPWTECVSLCRAFLFLLSGQSTKHKVIEEPRRNNCTIVFAVNSEWMNYCVQKIYMIFWIVKLISCSVWEKDSRALSPISLSSPVPQNLTGNNRPAILPII